MRFTSVSTSSAVRSEISRLWTTSRPRKISASRSPIAIGPIVSLMPYCVTMRRATSVACWMSCDAPVVTFSGPNTSSSATRPPYAMARRDRMDCLVYLCSSSSGRYAVIPSARPRGMIVTLCRGSEPGTLSDTRACPASWYAMRRRSSSDRTRLRRSRPSISLSFASSRSCMSTTALLRRAASSAPSFTTLASSAPARPGVPRAMRSRSTPAPRGILRVCTRRICSRPFTSGMSTTIWRSKRPGRRSAGSRMSGRLVAASRMTPSFDSKPSISTSNWFRVCSRSSCPPPSPAPRCRPTASISSMKMMHGACALPCSNRSRTREAPTPTNISTKSDPDIEKNGRPASPATALASSVFPVPGGPTSKAPLGSRPERGRRCSPRRSRARRAASSPFRAAAQPLELLGVLQEVDDLFELLLRFVRARDVGERHLGRVAREQLRLRLPERERPVPALLHLAQHEDQQTEDQQIGEEAEQEHAERLLLLARSHVDSPGAQRGDPGVARLERQQRGEVVEVAPADRHGGLEAAFHLLTLSDFDGVDVALVELLGELGVRDVHRLLPPVRGELDERDGAHDQQRPEREGAERAGPAEFARRRDAVGHQVRLATYGRCRKFSA